MTTKMSSKQKSPWMTYNGVEVADSQFCIEYLSRKRGIELDKHLSVEERAVAKAIRVMVDEHLYWPLLCFRWIFDKEQTVMRTLIPRYVLWFFIPHLRKQAWGQGMGRHTPDEVKQILLSDLQVLADYLGDKEFMMGSTPCEVDCSVFGMLSQLMWHFWDDVCKDLLQEQFPSLSRYCLRMKERFWPDWDECITQGGTRVPTK